MPIHHVPMDADALRECVTQLERDGETVSVIEPYMGQWLLITQPASRKRETRVQAPKETR